jgi:hypothetical protein
MKDYTHYYKLPLHLVEDSHWVYDETGRFVFQFEFDDIKTRKRLLRVINGEEKLTTDVVFHHKEGYIVDNDETEAILIRGWGGLTGIGGLNLSTLEAAHVQDTFAEYIVKQLNRR